MITYRFIILHLIREIEFSHPYVDQPFYADNAGYGDSFVHFKNHLEDIMVWGPTLGNFLKTTKRILVVSELNAQWEKNFFYWMGIKVVTRRCYLGVYIG